MLFEDQFEIMERPPITCHKRNKEWENQHKALEDALMATLDTEKAIRVPLYLFHRSGCKIKLWKKGYSVRHRVCKDNISVVAWVLPGVPKKTKAVADVKPKSDAQEYYRGLEAIAMHKEPL